MRVCVDARLIQQSGIGTLLKSFLRRLSQSGLFELILLCYEKDRAVVKHFSAQTILMKSAIYTVREQFEYLCKIPSCTLFWAPHFNIPLGPIRAKKRLTCICDVYHLAHFTELNWAQKIYAKCLYNGAFWLSDTILTLSEFSYGEILRHSLIKPKKIRIITPPLDYLPLTQKIQKKKFLLCVGNLKPHKNLLRLVQAYAKIQPQELLYIVGRKEGLKTLDTAVFQEIEKNSFLKQNVHFLGYVDDQRLKTLYAQALVFVFPSTYEGFGYPPLEAMASGCPVVAAKRASIPEVCGDAVEYIDPFSVDSLATGIQKLLKDEKRREELIQKGKEHIRKRKQNNEIVDLIHACCNST